MHIRTRTARLGAVGVGAVVVLAACGPVAGGTTHTSTAPAAAGVVMAEVPSSLRASAPVGKDDVRMTNFTFTPAVLTIRAGQTVRWVNLDSVAHTVDLSGIVSNVLEHGDTYTQTFTAPGTYPYTCSTHPFMHGTIVVTA